MRYGIIKTDKRHDCTTHWLNRGTLVRVLADRPMGELVETLYPVFGKEELGNTYTVKQQVISDKDYYEIPGQFGPLLEAWADLFQKTREFLCVV